MTAPTARRAARPRPRLAALWIAIALAAGASSWAVAAAAASVKVRETVELAQREIRAGRFAAAQAALAAETAGSPVDEARVGLARAELAYYRASAVDSPDDETIATVRSALRAAVASGDRALAADGQDLLALALYAKSFRAAEHAESRALLQRALAARQELGDHRGVAESIFHLGLTFENRQEPTAADVARAGELYRESLAIAKQYGFAYEASYSERHLAGQADDAGDLDAARAGFERSLALRRETGATLFLAPAMVALADVIAKQGDLAKSKALYEEAQAVARSIPAPRFEAAATDALALIGNAPKMLGPAELVLPEIASTERSEVRFTRTPGGRWGAWGSTDRPGGAGGWDLWMTDCARQPCAAARPLSINSTANDFDPAFSADGRTLYFFSNRDGGFGGDDLYGAAFDPATGEFGVVANLGPGVNSKGDEWAPTPAEDGRRLLFATDGRGGAGKHDLFVATKNERGEWTNSTPLTGDLNTAVDEFDATWLADGETIVFARSQNAATHPIALHWSRPDGGRYSVGVPFGPEINVLDGWTLGPLRDWSEPARLYVTSHHEGDRRGKLDIYAIRHNLAP